ncbi:RICIN domain-containing protein [Actinoplanes friuliensis]|uniref:Ricin B lectin n=1 Tax=Actinoplanes friuliensis DSM 7358 TaxID=1246995 RepID=U5W1J5_9ACTN|nr:RICIN domain-containing protein [Actinoplanes friuliensis]AGZ41786.1 Ricin B lectin [Actinoplanes friuliensis DSM 7358]
MSVRRRFLSAAVTALLTAGLLAPGAAAEAAPPGPTDFLSGFLLINTNSRKCLTVDDGSSLAVQRPCRDQRSQMWRMRLATWTGLFQIQNLRSGRCLTIAAGGKDNNNRAVQAPCDDAQSRRWRLLDAPGDTFLMRNANSGRCLTIAGGEVGTGVPAVQNDCDGHRSRRWSGELIGGNRP